MEFEGTSAIKWWSNVNVPISPSVFHTSKTDLLNTSNSNPVSASCTGKWIKKAIHPKVNLTNPGLDTQIKYHQNSKTRVPGAPQKKLMSSKN